MKNRRLFSPLSAAAALLAVALVATVAVSGSPGSGADAPSAPAEAPARPVKTMTIDAPGASSASALPGTVRAAHRVDLAFRVPGQIAEFPVREGQHVDEGQIVALLDDTDYALTARALAAQLRGAEAARSEARLNFSRQQELFAQGMVAKASYDNAETALEQAEAAVAQLEEQLAQARTNLAYTRLRAPFSGTVAATLAESFETVQAQQPVLKLQDISGLEVVIAVPESAIGRLAEGDRAAATFVTRPGTALDLVVTEIATEADAATRTYAVTLAPADPAAAAEASLLPGMTAEVALPAARRPRSAFTVPAAAVFKADDGRRCVWRLDTTAMTVHCVQVDIESLSADQAVVRGGLAEGDVIAAAGAAFLREGQRVRLLDREAN